MAKIFISPATPTTPAGHGIDSVAPAAAPSPFTFSVRPSATPVMTSIWSLPSPCRAVVTSTSPSGVSTVDSSANCVTTWPNRSTVNCWCLVPWRSLRPFISTSFAVHWRKPIRSPSTAAANQ